MPACPHVDSSRHTPVVIVASHDADRAERLASQPGPKVGSPMRHTAPVAASGWQPWSDPTWCCLTRLCPGASRVY